MSRRTYRDVFPSLEARLAWGRLEVEAARVRRMDRAAAIGAAVYVVCLVIMVWR